MASARRGANLPNDRDPGSDLRLLRSGLAGAAFFLGLLIFSLLFHGGFSVLGVKDERLEAVTRIIKNYFAFDVAIYVVWLLFLHLAVGFILGLWAGLIARGRWARAALIVFLHSLFYLRQIVLTPQLYAEFWMGRGGVRRTVQVFCTDHISPWIPTGILLALLTAALIRTLLLWRSRRGTVVATVAVLLAGAALFSILGRGRMSILMRPFYGGEIARTAASGDGRKNVIMLGIDSLRPDKLSGNGYPRDTTPNIDALIPKGTFFSHVYTSLPRTFPAVVSLLTGMTPPEHGVRIMFPTFESRAGIPPSVPRILADQGYRTAVVSDFAGDIFPRIDLGFQDIDTPNFNIFTLAQIRLTELMTHLFPYFNNAAGRKAMPILREFAQNADPGVLTDQAMIETDRLAGEGKPFFLMVFYSTTHFPFGAPYPYYLRYADKNYDGPHRYAKYTLVGVKETVTDADKAQVNALYDGALRAVDEQLERYLRYLDESGLMKNTVVMVFGDHGEDLYELPDTPVQHGEQMRSEFCLKTPLIVFGPGVTAGRRIDGRVRAIDVAPTILELAGVAAPGTSDRGLLPAMNGGLLSERPIYGETGLWYDTKGDGFYQAMRMPYPDVTRILEIDPFDHCEMVIQKKWEKLTNIAKHRAWIEGGFKLIRMPTLGGVIDELYDLNADPECRQNLAGQGLPEEERLAKNLDEYLSRVAPAEILGPVTKTDEPVKEAAP